MKSIELVLSRLRRVKKSGSGWTACCPAHVDGTPSLSIKEAEDGRVLLHCHAGCEVEAICGALGMGVRDLFAAGVSTPRPARSRGKTHESVEAAVRAASWIIEKRERSVWRLANQHVYQDASGFDVMQVLRFERGGEKTFVPIHRCDGGWAIGDPPGQLPLYRLPELAGSYVVYICEGEKAAETARAIGLVSTTSAHGSKSAKKTDWLPLAGRDVVILPDLDDAGKGYATDVARILAGLDPPAGVRIVELPDLPEHGDVVEFIEARQASGLADEAIRGEIIELASIAPVVKAKADAADGDDHEEVTPPRYTPFPVDLLPESLGKIVTVMSKSIGCDPTYIALPMLGCAAAAIGNTIEIEVKKGWREPCIFWAVIVGESGTLKSPALNKAMQPTKKKQAEAMSRLNEELKLYEEERLRYEVDLAKWKKKGEGSSPEKPLEPKPWRAYCSDVTVEAVAMLLLDQPRGLLLYRDELSGWILSFDQYKSGKGADVAHWLEMFGAGSMVVDRKTGKPRTIHVPRASMSVVGGIQPAVLRRALDRSHFENGLAARILLAQPPRRRRRWTDDEIPTEIEEEYEEIFDRLYELAFAAGADDEHDPNCVRLSPEAKRLWIQFYNEHGAEQVTLHGDLAYAWSKLEGYAVRIALLLHVLDFACGGEQSGLVSGETMARAIRLAEWFKSEARRVYGLLGETDEDRSIRELEEKIRALGGSTTVRAWQKRRSLKSRDDAEHELQPLVDAGRATWSNPAPGPRGGRPSKVLELVDELTDETPNTQAPGEVLSDETLPAGIEGGVLSGGEIADGTHDQHHPPDCRIESTDETNGHAASAGVSSAPDGTTSAPTSDASPGQEERGDRSVVHGSDETPSACNEPGVSSGQPPRVPGEVANPTGVHGEPTGTDSDITPSGDVRGEVPSEGDTPPAEDDGDWGCV